METAREKTWGGVRVVCVRVVAVEKRDEGKRRGPGIHGGRIKRKVKTGEAGRCDVIVGIKRRGG